jgi:hypothetical protein
MVQRSSATLSLKCGARSSIRYRVEILLHVLGPEVRTPQERIVYALTLRARGRVGRDVYTPQYLRVAPAPTPPCDLNGVHHHTRHTTGFHVRLLSRSESVAWDTMHACKAVPSPCHIERTHRSEGGLRTSHRTAQLAPLTGTDKTRGPSPRAPWSSHSLSTCPRSGGVDRGQRLALALCHDTLFRASRWGSGRRLRRRGRAIGTRDG